MIEVPAAYYNFTATNFSNIAIYILIDGTVNVVIALIAVTLTVTVVSVDIDDQCFGLIIILLWKHNMLHHMSYISAFPRYNINVGNQSHRTL